jgi:hypothetical protein
MRQRVFNVSPLRGPWILLTPSPSFRLLSRLGPTSRADKDLQRALIRLEIAKREVAEAERALQSIEYAQKSA